MKLTSSVFQDGGKIPSKYTCDKEGINPPLKIRDVPEGAKSLVLIVDDPDVPKSVREECMWDHWIVYNMPPTTTELKEGSTPAGQQGIGTGGVHGYEGPCPPDREHRYFFKLYALDTTLSLPDGASKEKVEKEMQGHILAESHLIGRYSLGDNT